MSESITIVDPVTGAPLAAQATLTGCFMIIATQIVSYGSADGNPGLRVGEQHTGPLSCFDVPEAISHCIGFNLITGAQTGQMFSVEAHGTGQPAAASLTT